MRGVLCLWHGYRFLADNKPARRLAYVPSAVALVLWGLSLYLGMHFLSVLGAHFFPSLEQSATGWATLIHVLLFLLLLPLTLLIAMVLTPLLCAPALEALVLLRERSLGVPARPAAGFWRELTCALRAQLGWLCLFGPVIGLLWVVALAFPPLALSSSVLQFFVGGAWLALSLLDYPLSLRGLGFRARLALFRRGYLDVFGFGAACSVLFAIPLFGVWGLPVAVVAAAELAAQLEG